jgi:hypothetical protein
MSASTDTTRALTPAESAELAEIEAALRAQWALRHRRDVALTRSLTQRLEALDKIRGAFHGPSFEGSERCRSGSLASGGTRSRCSCDVCW